MWLAPEGERLLNYFGMHSDELRKRIRGPGFRPFRVHLSDGRSYEVPHPEFIAVSQRLVAIMNEIGLSDLADPSHIVSLEEIAAQ
jgi:hypothetical protein